MGGNRYIGLHLVFELARQGHDVTVMNSHEAPLPEGARRLHGDRQEPGTIERVLTPHRDDFDVAVVHARDGRHRRECVRPGPPRATLSG